jgi:hypothetical protein
MTATVDQPTPYPDVNDLLRVLLERARDVLGVHFVGMYLDGSLTSGDFDPDSDIDFVIVTDQDVSGDLFAALLAMHDGISQLDTPWAIQLEGSYVSKQGIRRFDPQHASHPNLERGEGERLKMAFHDEAWNVHRSVLLERGITIVGPPPQNLIDPVSPDDLRKAMLPQLHGWAVHILEHPDLIYQRGYQSYVVLTLCRMLYTYELGQVASKPAAVRWSKQALPPQWTAVIDDAWDGRHNSSQEAQPEEIHHTLELIRYTLDRFEAR